MTTTPPRLVDILPLIADPDPAATDVILDAQPPAEESREKARRTRVRATQHTAAPSQHEHM